MGFQKVGLKIHYDSADGRYLVTRPDKQVAGMVKLVVFSKEGELQDVIEPTYYRIGWKRPSFHPTVTTAPASSASPPGWWTVLSRWCSLDPWARFQPRTSISRSSSITSPTLGGKIPNLRIASWHLLKV